MRTGISQNATAAVTTRPKRHRLQHRDGLRHEEEAPAIETVDKDAAEGAEDEARQELAEADEASLGAEPVS